MEGMVRIPGGAFLMGSEEFYPEELPVRTVRVEDFWIDARPVTVGEFRRFVDATGYVTVAERPLDPAAYPGADPAVLVPGSAVFCATEGPVALDSMVCGGGMYPGRAGTRRRGLAATSAGARSTR